VSGHPASFLRESLASWREGGKRGHAWKEVYSAGQGAGLVDEIKPIAEIVRDLTAS
jgi:hypothetical protein